MFEPMELTNDAVIKVIGVGGGGGNAVEHMVRERIEGVEFFAVNTDAQALRKTAVGQTIQIGSGITKGLGAGANPEVGRNSAEEDREALRAALEGADMVFVTAGEGGGTGTGAAPIIAQIAREIDALTVGVVTRPFEFEGLQRANNAIAGIEQLRKAVDTMIVIPNDRLLEIANDDLSVIDAYRLADEVLRNGVKGISDLITIPGLVNLDFADVKAVMKDAGTALMGIGSATGEDRAMRATENAISSPLLEARIDGAHGVLLSFQAGQNFSLREMDRASKLVKESVDPSANIIVGQIIDEALGDEVRVTVIAAGFDETQDHLLAQSQPVQRQAPVVPPLVVESVETHSHAAAPIPPVIQGEEFATPARPFAEAPAAPSPEAVPPARRRSLDDLDIPAFLFDAD